MKLQRSNYISINHDISNKAEFDKTEKDEEWDPSMKKLTKDLNIEYSCPKKVLKIQ